MLATTLRSHRPVLILRFGVRECYEFSSLTLRSIGLLGPICRRLYFSFGISSFVAHTDIEPTKEWQTQIETALATSDALVALLHPDFHASNWTDQEIGFAMGRGIPVFSVRFGQDPYGFIGRFQAFQGNDKKAGELALELFNTYRKHKQTQHRMAEILVGLLEKSVSYADTKIRLVYLEELEVWDPSFSTRIASALDNNGQISGSWTVPERIDALIKKWHKSN